MLCRQCIEKAVKKLAPNDIYVLHELKDRNAPQTGASRKELLASLNGTMSVFQLAQALMRLGLLGFIGEAKFGSSMVYYITAEGLLALEILKRQ